MNKKIFIIIQIQQTIILTYLLRQKKKKMATIPKTQQAAQVVSPGEAFHISISDDIPVPEPGPNEVLVKLSCTGLW